MPEHRCVLLHGWGLHGGIFGPLAERLAEDFVVSAPDLPGHGASPYEPGFDDLDGLVRRVEPQVTDGCLLLGWSLGGMVAAAIAAAGRVRPAALVLVATTPRFINGPDWRLGLPAAVLDAFAARLAGDYRALLDEFLLLQARGDEAQRQLIRALRGELFAHGTPSIEGLAAGLRVLQTADLRGRLGGITAPTLVISGEYDRLTPAAAGQALAAGITGARHCSIRGASHAPFLTQKADFFCEIEAFCRDHGLISEIGAEA